MFNNFSILVIDDEPLIVSVIKSQLRKQFGGTIEIETALNASDALEVLRQCTKEGRKVPLVICDYLMPGMKGDDLIVKMHMLYPHTLSVLLTGQIDVNAMGNIVNHAKLFRYLGKPWDEQDLLITAREAINSYMLTMTVIQQNEQILEYAFSNSHNVRGPLARILGLINLIKSDAELLKDDSVIDKLQTSALELDYVIRDITKGLAEKKTDK